MPSMDIPETMKAVRCYGPRDYRLEEVPVPRPGPGEVLVKVLACGVCASDGKCHQGAPLYWGDERRPQYVQPPVTAGHEFVGEVVALGEGAAEKYGLSVGDVAIAEQILPCWNCRFCKTGKYWVCRENNVFGFRTVAQGGMAEYMLYPAGSIVHKVPSSMPRRRAALIEPLACSIHAVQRAGIELGDVVVVAGAGTLGLGMIGAARLKSPGLLVAMDILDSRLEVAKQLGADLCINPSKEDPVERIMKLTDGYGCDVFIEATGHPEAVVTGLHMIRRLGTFVEFSVMAGQTTVDWTIIGDGKELDVRGSHLGPYCYPLAIDYIHRGLINVDPIVTHEMPLEEFEQAFEKVHSGRDSIKVLLIP
jgi:threonine dehydrogenase-like Zn-dependent dehydrogenase